MFFLLAEAAPMETQIIERMTTNGIMGALLIVIVYRLPTIVSLLMENRKEVAIVMGQQSETFVKTLKETMEKNDKKMDQIITSFESRFKIIEDSLNQNTLALRRLLEDRK